MYELLFYYGTGIISLYVMAIFVAGLMIMQLPTEWDDEDEQE